MEHVAQLVAELAPVAWSSCLVRSSWFVASSSVCTIRRGRQSGRGLAQPSRGGRSRRCGRLERWRRSPKTSQFRGLVHQVSDDALLAECSTTSRLTAYIGFDPTRRQPARRQPAELCNLRRLQLAGHRPIVLAGGATGHDRRPGRQGRRAARCSTREELDANLDGHPAAARALPRLLARPPGAPGALLLDNADWLGTLRRSSTSSATSASTSRSTRWSRRSPCAAASSAPTRASPTPSSATCCCRRRTSSTSSTHFGCTLQMGGSDQWGNITMGIELIRRTRQASAYALTSPLVLKADGTKFGKSEAGALYLAADADQPVRALPVLRPRRGRGRRHLPAVLHVPRPRRDPRARRATVRTSRAPRAAQRALAQAVVDLVHGEEETARVERASEALYSEDVVGLDEATLLMALADAPSTTPSRERARRRRARPRRRSSSTSASRRRRAQARTTIAQGGVYVNNRRVDAGARRSTAGDLIARPLRRAPPGSARPPPAQLRVRRAGALASSARSSSWRSASPAVPGYTRRTPRTQLQQWANAPATRGLATSRSRRTSPSSRPGCEAARAEAAAHRLRRLRDRRRQPLRRAARHRHHADRRARDGAHDLRHPRGWPASAARRRFDPRRSPVR